MIQRAGDLGDRAAGATLDFKFTSTAAGSSDTPYTLSGGTVSVYKDNSDVQSTAGVTLTADFDTITGLNHVRITTGSDGTFYSAGSEFQIVLTAGSIDGVDHTGYVIGSFSLANRPLQSIVNGGVTEASIAAGAFSATKVSADAIAKIADAVLRRQCDNAEASSNGDTLDLSSLYGLIQQAQESAISGTTLTVKKTDGSTTLGTKAVTVNSTTGNITAIS